MNLQPVPMCSLSRVPLQFGLGPFDLGRCMNPDNGADCSTFVVDDGTGYADLDGAPFRAYVCGRCAARVLQLA